VIISLFFITITILIYWICKKLHKKFPILILSPILMAPILIIVMLVATKVPYPTYQSGGKWLSSMMGPAAAALAVPLYKHFDIFKKYASIILLGTLGGTVMGIASAYLLSQLFHFNHDLLTGLVLHTTTTAFAVPLTGQLGGITSITSIFVLTTGLLGSLFGPMIIRIIRIRHDVAKGVLMGTSAHTAGANKAFEYGELCGAIATISMMVTAFFMLAVVPLISSGG